MPSKRAPGDRRLERALRAFAKALNQTDSPWMVIGGVAIIARGVRRMTTDIDAVVRGDSVSVPALLRVLAKQEIEPRIDDVEAFASRSLVLLLRHAPTGVDLDVSLGWTGFEHEALAERTDGMFGEVQAPMARAEDLVVFKAMAARPKDIDDAAALLLMHRDIDLARVRSRLAELAAMADEPALVDGLERVIALARSSHKPAPQASRPRAEQAPASARATVAMPKKSKRAKKRRP